jgi:DNA repair protein RadC
MMSKGETMYQLTLFGDLQQDVSALSLKVLRERPGDRVLDAATAATSLDLLSAVLGDPDAALRVLAKFSTMIDLLRASPAELRQVKGVGRRGAARIKAAFELGRRLMTSSPDERPQVKSPADAANLLVGEMGSLEQECMRVILLDTRNRVQAIHTVYQGSLNTTTVRVGELFREAIRANSAAIIVAHNHPSGDPSPSPEDVSVTQQIVQAGKLMDIELLDHLVVAVGNRWVSLKERGLGF